LQLSQNTACAAVLLRPVMNPALTPCRPNKHFTQGRANIQVVDMFAKGGDLWSAESYLWSVTEAFVAARTLLLVYDRP